MHLHIYFCYLLLDVVYNSCHLLVLVQLSLVSIRSSVSTIFTSVFYYFLRVETYPCALQAQGSHFYPCSEDKFSLQLWRLCWVDPIGSLGQTFYSQVFKMFALVFQKFHVKSILDSCLFKFLVISKPPQGQSKPIWPQYQLLLAIHGLQITQLCKNDRTEFLKIHLSSGSFSAQTVEPFVNVPNLTSKRARFRSGFSTI